jgi:CRP-like cAMP-binding protein
MSEVRELLKRSHLAHGVAGEHFEAIAALGTIEKFRPRDRLGSIGDAGSDLFIISEGRVSVLTADDDKLREVGPAGVVGEVGFVDAAALHANFVAVGPVTAVRFPAKELRAILSANRESGFMFLANLARLLASRLRSADGRLDTLMDLEVDDVWQHSL